MDTLAIIKRIELRLVEIGMSKTEFYEKSGISSASYSQWNTGRYNPSKKKLKEAAKCIGVTYEYLVFGPEENIASPEEGKRTIEDPDDFIYAMSQESPFLSERSKSQLRAMAKILRETDEKERET